MRNLKLTMAYRGTRYHGFQRQNNAHTVQAEVEAALSRVLNEPVTIYGCSRTDAGVHANHYCFSLQTDRPIPHRNLLRGVNGLLPDDISLLSSEDAPPDFHARYSCCGKEYIYRIHNSESKNPFERDLSLHYRRPMHLAMLQQCADVFVGTHDFKSFCAANSPHINTIRTIYEFSIKKHEDCVILLVKGDGFLYNMIRILVGTLLWVNEGILPPDSMQEILDAKSRLRAGKTAQAYGLYLNRVFYEDGDWKTTPSPDCCYFR